MKAVRRVRAWRFGAIAAIVCAAALAQGKPSRPKTSVRVKAAATAPSSATPSSPVVAAVAEPPLVAPPALVAPPPASGATSTAAPGQGSPPAPGATSTAAPSPGSPPAPEPASAAKSSPVATPESDATSSVVSGAAPPASPDPAAAAMTAAPPLASSATDMQAAAARGDYQVRLRDLEERVNSLKERIFQSKARLIQLQEVVLHGTIAGAKAVLIHRNEMGSSFKLSRVQYALDGAPIFNRADTGAGELEAQDEIEVYAGSVAPGNHQIAVYLEYQGYGFGLFSYLKDYRFKIKSSYTFNAEEGKLTTVRVVGCEKGGITTELKDRPTVRYDVETTRDLRASSAEQGQPASGAAGDSAP